MKLPRFTEIQMLPLLENNIVLRMHKTLGVIRVTLYTISNAVIHTSLSNDFLLH